ncbi:MAG: hypothetical protein H5T99_14330, partial [Moorella sp. (in: Bacteria)]|nr:hypothetical protein [Moorella sp. (in: firmicutes)]
MAVGLVAAVWRSRLFRGGLLLVIIGLVAMGFLQRQGIPALAARNEQKELRERLHQIFTARSAGLVSGNYQGLEVYYDTTVTSGLFALNHEIGRIKYVQAWTKERRVILSGSYLDLAIIDAGSEGGRGWASVSQHIILNYRHQGEPETTVNKMGVRTIHWVEMVQCGGRWLITRDWYWDPFEADDLEPDIAPGIARGSL